MSYNIKRVSSPLRGFGISLGIFKMLGSSITERIIPENNGFLRELPCDSPVEFIISVKIPKNKGKYAVIVEGRQKKITSTENISSSKEKLFGIFIRSVANRETANKTVSGKPILSTKHEGNNIRLIIVKGNIFQMWEIAISTRITNDKALFFLTVQKLYQARLFILNGEIYAPEWEFNGYAEWDSLHLFLRKAVDVTLLDEIASPIPEPRANDIPLPNGIAKIDYFCLASGIGMATTNRGRAFIHWKDILSGEKFAYLLSGQLIKAEIITNEKGILQLKKMEPIPIEVKYANAR